MAGAKPGALAFSLVSYYQKGYKEKYEREPVGVNKFASRWFFETLLQDMTADEVKSLIDYYFITFNPHGHSFEWFQYNYHKLRESKVEYDKDKDARTRRAEESRRRTEEWRAKIAKRTESS